MTELGECGANFDEGITAPLFSIIIPVHNEEEQIEQCIHSVFCGFFPKEPKKPALANRQDALLRSEVEFIVVDANSRDRTPKIVDALVKDCASIGILIKHVRSPQGGRAHQMNYGASFASGQVLVFLHADTRIEHDFAIELKRFTHQNRVWGFCRVRFDSLGWEYKMVSFMINLRSRLFGISTGDQTQFVQSKEFHRVGGFPAQPLMEDIELSKSLKARSKPFLLNAFVKTSSRKWRTEGFWRTVVLMWKLRFSYWRGATAESIHRRYYRP